MYLYLLKVSLFKMRLFQKRFIRGERVNLAAIWEMGRTKNIPDRVKRSVADRNMADM